MKLPSLSFYLIIFQIINIISSLPFLNNYLSYLYSPLIDSIISKKNLSIFNHNYFNDDSPTDYGKYRDKLFKILIDEVESTNISNSGASQSCINVCNRYLFGHTDPNNKSYIDNDRSTYHIIKALDDSSKSRSFLGSYDNCMLKTYRININDNNRTNETTSTYVVLTLDKTDFFNERKDLYNWTYVNFEELYYLIAFCLPQGYKKINSSDGEYCTDEDYSKLIEYINMKLGDNLHFWNKTYRIFSLRENPHESEKDSRFYIFICLMPFFFFAIQIFLIIFRYLFLLIFQKIYLSINNKNKQKDKNELEKNKMEDSIDDSIDNYERISDVKINEKFSNNELYSDRIKLMFKITDCFCFTENASELFNFSLTSTKFNNDSGISNVRGINGISIFLMIIGWTFIILFNSPVKIYYPSHIKNFLEGESIFSIFVMIGVRYAPRVIISCSGYILIYKYISYLERNVTNNSEIFSVCIKFFIYQSYKYILLILLLLFERYSLYQIYILINSNTPIWKFFHLYILKKPSIGQFFLSFIMIKYIIPTNPEENYRTGNNLLHYFWLPFNEIFFFIVGVILITIGYKKKYRIDKFILFLIPFIFLFKVIFSYTIKILLAKKNYPFKKYIPTYYFTFFNYGRFMINPLFNLPYFLIGMYFGLMNYTIQKGILNLNKCSFYSNFNSENDNNLLDIENKKEIDNDSSQEDNDLYYSPDENINKIKKDEQNINNNNNNKFEYCIEVTKMPFLITPIIFVQWHRKQKMVHLLILILIFVILSFFFIMSYYIPADIEDTMNSSFINFIYRIDIEFIVLFVQWGAFIIFLKANNFAAIFLSHVFWTMLSKPYFSFLLIINTVLLFIFYQSEAMIEINTMNILLNSMIGGAVTFIFTCLFYIFFELPYKRLIHLILSLRNNKNAKDIDNEFPDGDEDSSDIEDKESDDKEKNE